MKTNKECNICKMEITSDATNDYYCKLCGMLVDKEGIVKKIKGSMNYFCCKVCMNEYFAFKFNNKFGG